MPLATIITTHQHWDHWGALEEVQRATSADTVAHPEDAGEMPVPITHLVRHGDTVAVGQRDAVGDPPARAHAGQHRAAL